MAKSTNKIFFNHATVGPLNKPAYKAVLKFLAEYYYLGPPEVLEKYDNYINKMAFEASALLNCAPEEITYVKNTSEGIIIAAESLLINAGDQIILMSNEYPANLLPWLKKKKDGALVTVVEAENSELAYKKLIKSINQKIKVVAISWGQCYDGFLPDLENLSKICQKHGAFLVVDGAHGVGARVLDLQKIHIDIMSCGGQKNLKSLVGSGILYINKNTLLKLKDFKVSIRSVKNFDSTGYVLKDTAERFQDGTQNLAGIVSLHASLKSINKIGVNKIEQKNLFLLNSYKKILKENNIPFFDYRNQVNIISLKVTDPVGLALFLRKRGIYIKAVKDVARISFSHTSTIAEFKIAIKFIKLWLKKSRTSSLTRSSKYAIINYTGRSSKTLTRG
ncbi:MAG: aminotransferase class V-fold PLP-dependent enzyme [Candidatus Staskawiczbacteria bacterium]|nr:aminotransferase class V-fold PLP-dependent enzyme [Candidatus Staskawiczbacteria bacterium]